MVEVRSASLARSSYLTAFLAITTINIITTITVAIVVCQPIATPHPLFAATTGSTTSPTVSALLAKQRVREAAIHR